MQSTAIIVSAMMAAILYGVIHDQITARLSLEYFTVAHPRLFAHNSPTLHALAWGVLATWWVGAALGVLLAVSARAGRLPKLSVRRVLPLIAGVLSFSAGAAFITGVTVWSLGSQGSMRLPEEWAQAVSPSQQLGFLTDMWVHLSSYLAGGLSSLAACGAAVYLRARGEG